MSNEWPEACPSCKADLRAGLIPEEHREDFGGRERFLRTVGIYSRDLDRVVEWGCPDCKHRWPVEVARAGL